MLPGRELQTRRPKAEPAGEPEGQPGAGCAGVKGEGDHEVSQPVWGRRRRLCGRVMSKRDIL